MDYKDQNKYEKYHKLTGIQKKILTENNFTHYNSFKVIKKYLRGNEVLEIGCGAGSNSFFIASKGLKVTAIDISKKAVDKCIESSKFLKLQHLTNFIHSDFLQYTTNKRFDSIVCYEVLEHLENDEKAIKKIEALLNDGGIALISVPSVNSILFRIGYSKGFDNIVGHKRRYNEQSITNLCRKTNLKIIQVIKIEGPIRDFLFLIKPLSFAIRYIRFILSDIINKIDSLLALVFGECRIIVVLKK